MQKRCVPPRQVNASKERKEQTDKKDKSEKAKQKAEDTMQKRIQTSPSADERKALFEKLQKRLLMPNLKWKCVEHRWKWTNTRLKLSI
jgi:hypothetical protein